MNDSLTMNTIACSLSQTSLHSARIAHTPDAPSCCSNDSLACLTDWPKQQRRLRRQWQHSKRHRHCRGRRQQRPTLSLVHRTFLPPACLVPLALSDAARSICTMMSPPVLKIIATSSSSSSLPSRIFT